MILSKNSDVLQLMGRVTFVRALDLVGWWDWSEEFRQEREVTISTQPDEVNILCGVTGFLIDKC